MNPQHVLRMLGSILIVVFLSLGTVEAQRRVPLKSKQKPPVPRPSGTIVKESKSVDEDFWVQIYGARVFGIYHDVIKPEVIYATTPIGLYKSNDKGFRWTFVFSPAFPDSSSLGHYPPTEGMNFAQSKTSPSVMYVTAEWKNGGWVTVWRSDNGGITWSKATGGVIGGSGRSIISLQVSSQNHAVAYLHIGDYIYKTLNGGKSWGRLSMPDNWHWKSFGVSSTNHDNLFAQNWARESQYWESTDGGLSWNKRDSALRKPLMDIKCHPTNSTIIFGRLEDVNYVLSEDGGTTWTDITIKEFVRTVTERHPILGTVTSRNIYNYPSLHTLEFSKDSDQTLYAGTGAGTYVSEDRGRNWRRILDASSHSLAIANSNNMYVATGSGILKSSNGGISWQASSFGLPNLTENYLSGVDAKTDTIYIGSKGGYSTTTDSGFTWQWVGIGSGNAEVRRVLTSPDGTSFLTTYDSETSKGAVSLIKRTADGKFTNSARQSQYFRYKEFSDLIIGLSLENPQLIYAGSHISDDGGFSWRQVDVLSKSSPGKVTVSPLSSKVAYLYGGEAKNSIFVSVDGGDNWRETSLSLYTQLIYPDPQDAKTAYLTDGNSVFRSHDAGLRWENLGVMNQFGTIYDIAISPSANKIIYLASNKGVWRSIDAGKSWHSYSRGLNGDSIFRIVASAKLLVCKGRNGIYRLSDEKMTWAANLWGSMK